MDKETLCALVAEPKILYSLQVDRESVDSSLRRSWIEEGNMSDPQEGSDGPTLFALIVLGVVGGIFIAFMALDRNKDFLGGLGLIGVILVGLCGGLSMNSSGPVRAAFVVLASVGAGILAAVVTIMK